MSSQIPGMWRGWRSDQKVQTRNMALEPIDRHGPATLTCHLDTLVIEYHGPATLTLSPGYSALPHPALPPGFSTMMQ